MALVLADRVKDTTITTGTGTITLSGSAPAGFQSFAAIGNGNTTYYTIAGGSQWEVGIGTYTASGTTLSRDTVLSSSEGGTTKVDFSAGAKDVFVTYPAERSVYEDAAGNINTNITGNAASLAGGASGSIPYQSGVGATTFLASGTGVLVNSAGNPSYSMTPSLTQVTVAGNPTAALEVATKQYVDALIASGIHFHAPVRVESPINLNATYNNGTSGVGATLTNAGTQVALVIDGVTLNVNDRVLIFAQTTQTQNGIYVVTSVGSGSTNWVLTRATDADTYVINSADGLSEGSTVFVQQGATGAGQTYTCNTSGVITFGTTAITFVQISTAQIYSAGAGLTLTGTQFSLTAPVTAALGGTGLTSPGASGNVLVSNGAAWTSAALAAGITFTDVKTANYTAAAYDGVQTSTVGGSFTVTLPATPATGAQVIITDAGGVWGTNNLIVGRNGSTIEGIASDLICNISNVAVQLVFSGTTWTVFAQAGGAGGVIDINSQTTGTLDVARGGTGATTLAANNVLLGNGTSALQAVAPGAAGNLLTSNGTTWTSATPAPSGPTLTAIASGSLSDGSRVIVNADGTVSVVAAVTQAAGTPVVFRSAGTDAISATYDSATQRVVIAYQGDTNFPTAIVGTVSGTSISFGTPVVLRSVRADITSATYDSAAQRVVIVCADLVNFTASVAIVGTVSGTSISFGTAVSFAPSGLNNGSVTYDSAAQRVVIAYSNRANSNFGTAIVGTVSGTSISFGTAVVFQSGNTEAISATYDSAAQRVVIAYQNTGGTAFGTAIVGTVSGTSISFGTAVVFQSTGVSFNSLVYDSVQQRVVIAYQNTSTGHGTAIVGTVSGTSISFGTAVVFRSASVNNVSAAYDSNAQRVTIAYRDNGNSNFGTAIVGTVSGTSITFGTAVVFQSATTGITSATYDSAAQRVVIAYRNLGNSAFGTSVVFQNASTNLTSGNFIGFSNAAYTNGQTATIQIAGSVDDAQSGLTPGRAYFVQNNGTLGLTPGTPSVFAGTAVAANRIIVKG